MWTVQFICLADRLTTKVPTTTERQILHKAGLDLKKIKLYLDDDEIKVKEMKLKKMVLLLGFLSFVIVEGLK
jgi:hypothetical protein